MGGEREEETKVEEDVEGDVDAVTTVEEAEVGAEVETEEEEVEAGEAEEVEAGEEAFTGVTTTIGRLVLRINFSDASHFLLI